MSKKVDTGYFLKTMKALHDAADDQVLLVFPESPAPHPNILGATLVAVLDENTANGPDECAAKDWLVPWGKQLNAWWSIWAAVPDVKQVQMLVMLAAMANGPLIIIITEDKYFKAWAKAIGPEHKHGMHVVFNEGANGIQVMDAS